MRIVYVTADTKEEWNCAEWRCAIPTRAINRLRDHSAQMIDWVSFSRNTSEAQSVCGKSDVIVIQRNLFGPVLSTIQHWKAKDKVILVDFDDAFNLMPPEVKNYSFWIDGKYQRRDPVKGLVEETMEPSPLTQFKWGLRLVHGATVPSSRLAEDWKAYQTIHLAPNYFEVDKYVCTRRTKHDRINIGWGGSLSHFQSFTGSGIVEALQQVCRSRPEVNLVICGDQRVYDLLPVPENQKQFIPWMSADKWPNTMASFDIGIAPLSGPYDERRSWIKVMEYMLMKIPWIASDNTAYNELRSYGWLVQNTAGAWERVIQDMVDHLDEYQAEANGESYLYAISQNIDENIEKIISIYSNIAAQVTGESTQVS